MAAPSDEQVGVSFLAKVGFERSITGVDTSAEDFTFDDTDNAMGDELTSGDALEVTGSTGNDGDYTVSSVSTGTDQTTVTVNEDITDSTADGTILYKPKVGGSTSATRTRSTSMVQTTNKDSGRWQEQQASTQEETIEFDSMFLESDSEQTGLGMTVEVDSGSGFNSMSGVNSVTVSINVDLITVANNDTSRWAEREPSTRSVEFSIDRDYIDPQNDTAFDDCLTAADNGNTVAVKVTLQTFTITFDAYVTEEGLETPHDDTATSPLTLQSDGSETTLSRSSQQDGLGNLFAGIFADPTQQLHSRVNVVDTSGSQVSGATEYTGNFYPESLEIEIPVEDAVTASGTLQNDGSITRATQ